jgi:hypothetical protein
MVEAFDVLRAVNPEPDPSVLPDPRNDPHAHALLERVLRRRQVGPRAAATGHRRRARGDSPGGDGPVAPFHSRNPGRPLVYHDRADCYAGRQVPLHNRIPGTGGHRRCQHCVAVEASRVAGNR